MKRTVVGLAVLAFLVGSPLGAPAAIIVYQPLTMSVGRESQVYSSHDPSVPLSAFEFDDFSTTLPYYLTTLTAYGVDRGSSFPATGEIWNGRPGSFGGSRVMSGSGSQAGTDLTISFGGQLLAPGNYWLTAYVTRPYLESPAGFWGFGLSLPVTGRESNFYNPGDGYLQGTDPIPGSTVSGDLGHTARFSGVSADLAFKLEGNAVPEPTSLAALLGLAVAGTDWHASKRRRILASTMLNGGHAQP